MIRTCDLTNQLGTPYPRPILRCPMCGDEFSAHVGDYSFWRGPDDVFECERCQEPLALVVPRVTFKRVIVRVK